MTTPQLLATIVAVLLAASRLSSRLRPFWALLPEKARPWAPAAVVITGTLAGLLAGGVSPEDAVFEVVVAVVTALGLAAPGLPPQDPPANAPSTLTDVQTASLASALAVAVAALLAFSLPACTPSTVQLGADAVRTTCATCRAIRPVCDTVSPAPSGSAAQ